VRLAERIDAQDDAEASERDLAVWRHEIRLQALAHLASQPDKPSRSVRIGVFVVLILVLTASLVGLRRAMRPKISPNEVAIEIRLIEEARPEPPGRSPSAPKAMDGREGPTRVVTHATAARRIEPPAAAPQRVSTVPEPESVPAYRVFNPDGSVIIPPAGANQGMQASFVAQSTAPSPLMQHQRPLKVRPNHFAQNWQAPPDETLLGSFVREHLTSDTRQFMTPWGTLVKCGVVVLIAGCTWGPPPARESRPTWQPASALDEQ
jgi:hypothetical protein